MTTEYQIRQDGPLLNAKCSEPIPLENGRVSVSLNEDRGDEHPYGEVLILEAHEVVRLHKVRRDSGRFKG